MAKPNRDITPDELGVFNEFIRKLTRQIEPDSPLANVIAKLAIDAPIVLATRIAVAAQGSDDDDVTLGLQPLASPSPHGEPEPAPALEGDGAGAGALNWDPQAGKPTADEPTLDKPTTDEGVFKREFQGEFRAGRDPRMSLGDFLDEIMDERSKSNALFPKLVAEATARREARARAEKSVRLAPPVIKGKRAHLTVIDDPIKRTDLDAMEERTRPGTLPPPKLGADELLAIEKLVEHLRAAEVEGESSKDGILLGLASALGGKGGRERDLVFARRAYEEGKREGARQLSASALRATESFAADGPDDTAEMLAGIIAAVHEAFDLSAVPELEADVAEVARAYAEPLELSPEQVNTIERRIAAARNGETTTIPIEEVFTRANAAVEEARAARRDERDLKKNPLVSLYETMTPEERAGIEHATAEDRKYGGLPKRNYPLTANSEIALDDDAVERARQRVIDVADAMTNNALNDAAKEIETLADALVHVAQSKDHASAVEIAREAVTLFEGR